MKTKVPTLRSGKDCWVGCPRCGNRFVSAKVEGHIKTRKELEKIIASGEAGCAYGHHNYVLIQQGEIPAEDKFKCKNCPSTDPEGDSCATENLKRRNAALEAENTRLREQVADVVVEYHRAADNTECSGEWTEMYPEFTAALSRLDRLPAGGLL